MAYLVDARGVRASLQRMYGEVPDIANSSMKKAMEAGKATARDRCPVDTGKLKKSIKYRIRKNKASVTGNLTAYAENSKGKDYSRYQEAGFTHWKSGHWHEGKRFMLAGQKRAEKVLMDESNKQIKGMIRE